MALATLHGANCAIAQTDQILSPMGGYGGGQYVARCPQGQLLSGFELRTGDDVDAIRPICVTAYAPDYAGPRSINPAIFGGPGGAPRQLVCPDYAPVIAGLEIGYEGERTRVVNNVHLYCGLAAVNQPWTPHPTLVFDGPEVGLTSHGPFTGGDPVFVYWAKESCPSGLVAVGINGRSGVWLDAVGLICGALVLDVSKAPIKSIGRVGVPSTAPPRPICDAARDARARNSPAAPGLEAQCRAFLAAQTPVKSIGRAATPSLGSAPRPICDAARDARARNSPAAPGLEAQCRAFQAAQPLAPMTNPQDMDAMAARGNILASQDPLALELRNRIAPGPGQRGFDIGMAAAEGQTAPGPGKQRIHDALPIDQQAGYALAVAFSLERNKNMQSAPMNGVLAPSAVPAPSAVVISQVYGGGGSAGAAFAGDYVELLNRGADAVDINGWSLQYASGNGLSWQVTPLMGSILPGHYFLIAESPGAAAGAALPTPDSIGHTQLSSSVGKVALLRTQRTLSGYCPAGADVVDFVGYGAANCSEGGAPAPEPGGATAVQRRAAGCIDTNANAADFEVATPDPRNQIGQPAICAP